MSKKVKAWIRLGVSFEIDKDMIDDGKKVLEAIRNNGKIDGDSYIPAGCAGGENDEDIDFFFDEEQLCNTDSAE